jgi:regulator of PEP synthase PpsR (kinase-PPPase family)
MTSNSRETSADRFELIVARVLAAVEARGYPLDDIGGKSVEEIAAELRAEFSSDQLPKEPR